ncbi:MAG: hypothetical protein ACLT76_09390 [Clostridium fessum]
MWALWLKGLIGVGVLCTELALFLKATDLDGMGVLKGTGLVLLAASINILADAVEAFGSSGHFKPDSRTICGCRGSYRTGGIH